MDSQRHVYLDHAATTPIDQRVTEVMLPFMTTDFGNPSSFHILGKTAKDALEAARRTVAEALGARPDEILFTSGGTEADNLAILGFARKQKAFGNHIISTKAEHPAVLEAIEHLVAKEGFEVTYLELDRNGEFSVQSVIDAITEKTILVSLMYANNEIGTVYPISEIGVAIQKYKKANDMTHLVFHTDACQAVGALDIDVQKLHVDMMTVNSSKIYGPKGVGALYVKRGIKLEPLQFGGSQESSKRPGTENIIGIIGFAKAMQIALLEQSAYVKQTSVLRDALIQGIEERIPKIRLNGSREHRLPNNVNISFMDIEGEALLLYLDAKGVYASTGSACTSATLDPSHVILALGLPYEVAHGSLRFTLGRSTTQADIDYVLDVLPPLVEKLRKISPVNVDEKYYE